MNNRIARYLKKDTGIVRMIFYAGLTFQFGYASLYKVFEWKPMMDGMVMFGFDRVPTLIIGTLELLGTIGLIAGIFYPRLLRISILFLIPFAFAAFASHMAHREYHHFYNSLFCSVATVFLLVTDTRYKIVRTDQPAA